MKDFYSDVVPRIRDKVFGASGQNAQMKLCKGDKYTLSVIYHAIKEKSAKGIETGIQRLLKDDILSNVMEDPLVFWKNLFVDSLLQESGEFFNTCTADLGGFRLSLFSGVLN